MGIGFGVLLARHWFARAQTFRTAISVIDIDVALRTGFTVAGRGRRAVQGVAKNRPDYLLISNAGGAPVHAARSGHGPQAWLQSACSDAVQAGK